MSPLNRPFPPLRERGQSCLTTSDQLPLNISKTQQRTLHALAQGGHIDLIRDNSRILDAQCWNREGWRVTDCTLQVFKSLKRKGLIASQGGGPYRITREGLANLRAQLDNRVASKGW